MQRNIIMGLAICAAAMSAILLVQSHFATGQTVSGENPFALSDNDNDNQNSSNVVAQSQNTGVARSPASDAFRAAYPESWTRLLPKNLKNTAGFNPPKSARNKKRLLIIGDSISLCYTPYVRRKLQQDIAVHRVPHNGASTELGLASIDAYLEAGPWDYITVNWGLHDLIHNKRQTSAGVVRNFRTKPDAYEARLRKLVGKLKRSGARVTWIDTTPVLNSARYEASDVPLFNKAAHRVMDQLDVPTVNFETSRFRTSEIEHQPDRLHFTAATCKLFGNILADEFHNLYLDNG